MAQNPIGNPQLVYKSRYNLLNILQSQGFDVMDYTGSSVSEVHSMMSTKQLDMLITREAEPEKKVYVKYHLAKGLRQNNIHEYIEDLYQVDQILTKEDDLYIIVKDEPNEPLQKILRNIWEQEGYFVIVISLARLQFNILKHTLVPPHRKLSVEEAEAIKLKYNISNNSEIPDISRFSPVSQAIGLRPGEMCEIERPSKTGISSLFYRICSA